MTYPFNADELWADMLDIFRAKVGKKIFEEAFQDTEIELHDGNNMVIITPTQWSHLSLSTLYSDQISRLASLLTDQTYKVTFDNRKHRKPEMTFDSAEDRRAIARAKSKYQEEKPIDHNIPLTADEIWGAVLKTLSNELSGPSYETWLKPIKPISIEEDFLIVEAPNDFAKDWLETRYKAQIDAILSRHNKKLKIKGSRIDLKTCEPATHEYSAGGRNPELRKYVQELELKVEQLSNRLEQVERELELMKNG